VSVTVPFVPVRTDGVEVKKERSFSSSR